MTEVLYSPSHFPSSPRTPSGSTSSSSSLSSLSCAPYSLLPSGNGGDPEPEEEEDEGFRVNPDEEEEFEKQRENKKQQQREELSLLALIVTIFRKSLVACKSDRRELCAMEIGFPTNVRHVAHVTFDRFNGFLGLPVEFEPEVPRRAPSASTTVFGVSTESMQLSYDSRGNIVPTILLLMQSRLYAQGGLQAEGIFRITGGNSQEEFVRDQLNRGVVAEGIDVHCLAGLIKAWFRELPNGVLDSLTPEEVMQCQEEEECVQLVRRLPPTESSLLDWVVNLMADVVLQEHVNKMNARNIAMVFAPNMTKMADPLTALMYVVQVMNFLKTLILRALREREDSALETPLPSQHEPLDEDGNPSSSLPCKEEANRDEEMTEQTFIAEEPATESSCDSCQNNVGENDDSMVQVDKSVSIRLSPDEKTKAGGQSSNARTGRSRGNVDRQQSGVGVATVIEKSRGLSNLSRIDSRTELIEAWR
ncbi:Rho GTPase-activating protein 1 [Euphorbia peplus]|nr:Rho GTPase-activating protein 1 [Euphorbia peplus]